MRRPGLLVVVLEHVAFAARRKLLHPVEHRRTQGRDARVGDQPARGQDVQRPDVGRRGFRHRVVEPGERGVARALVGEREPRAAHADERARVPEALAGRRRDAVEVPRAIPVVDEVDPPSIGLLHPQHELEHPASPSLGPRLLRPSPHVAQHVQQPGRVVHARDPFEAGLFGDDVRSSAVAVDRDG